MIALNREMPQDCLDCPCLGTYDIENRLMRICHANFKNIYQTTFDEYENNEEVQRKWMVLTRPEWCPWVDVGNANLKWTITIPKEGK